jgi:hypothetical protein
MSRTQERRHTDLEHPARRLVRPTESALRLDLHCLARPTKALFAGLGIRGRWSDRRAAARNDDLPPGGCPHFCRDGASP